MNWADEIEQVLEKLQRDPDTKMAALFTHIIDDIKRNQQQLSQLPYASMSTEDMQKLLAQKAAELEKRRAKLSQYSDY
jgi:DNA-binding transcriptional regulator/RsmH inhibitor MraZ